MNNKNIVCLSLAIVIAACVIAYAISLNGRFAMAQKENNRMVLLDTKTGDSWDEGNGQWIARPAPSK